MVVLAALGNTLLRHLPDHSVGDYNYAFLEGRPLEATAYSLRRLVTSVLTRFHLTHPWWIPAKLLGEFRGVLGDPTEEAGPETDWRQAEVKVLHFATHPIQYFAPLYREVVKCNRFQLDVLFGSDFWYSPIV